MEKPRRITDYEKAIHTKNRFYLINSSNIENGLNVYEDKDGRPFFNLLSTRVFPTEMAPYSYVTHKTNGSETLQNIAWKYYEATRLWWVIAEANHLHNPFEILKPGLLLKIPNNLTISDILKELRS